MAAGTIAFPDIVRGIEKKRCVDIAGSLCVGSFPCSILVPALSSEKISWQGRLPGGLDQLRRQTRYGVCGLFPDLTRLHSLRG